MVAPTLLPVWMAGPGLWAYLVDYTLAQDLVGVGGGRGKPCKFNVDLGAHGGQDGP